MGIPFQIPAKSMKDEDKTGREEFRFIVFVEHVEDDASDRRKKTVQKRAVFQEIGSQFFGNGEDEVSVLYVDNFKRHGGGTVNGVFIAAGRAEAAFATERDKLQVAALGASIHGTAIGRVTTMNHPVYVIHNRGTGMGSIFNFFIMVTDDFLQYIHKTIMRENGTKRNPQIPSRLRGTVSFADWGS